MKKIFKILFLNIGILFFVFFIIELFLYLSVRKLLTDINTSSSSKWNISLSYYIKLEDAAEHFKKDLKYLLRKPVGLSYNKKSIVLFGCSYTFGSGLEENQTFAKKLSDYTKRPVFNRGIPASGIQHMYFQLNSDSLYKDITVEPEYMMYLYSYDLHCLRLILYTFMSYDTYFYLRYYPDKFAENGDLLECKPFLPVYFNGLYTVRWLERLNAYRIWENNNNAKFFEDFCFLIFHKSKEKALQHYPNIKFVIFCFDKIENEYVGHEGLLKRLQDDGFIVLKMDELTDSNLSEPKWQISAKDSHPNEAFWDYITPKIAKKLNL